MLGRKVANMSSYELILGVEEKNALIRRANAISARAAEIDNLIEENPSLDEYDVVFANGGVGVIIDTLRWVRDARQLEDEHGPIYRVEYPSPFDEFVERFDKYSTPMLEQKLSEALLKLTVGSVRSPKDFQVAMGSYLLF
jgi:hypothetical protein